MRKLILTLLLVMTGMTAAWSQSANRSGFFMEAAIGGATGKTPQVAFSVENNILKAHTLTGPVAAFALGPRFRISNYAAYELVLEFQGPLDAIKAQPTAKLMPVAFRFTSPEFYRNYSIYGTIRLGGAVGFAGDGNLSHITTPDMPKQDISIHSNSSVTGGAVAHLGLGVNVTTHFYAGATWDMQYMFQQYRGYKRTNCLWGMVGLRLGYRF